MHETVHQAQCQALEVTHNSPQVADNVTVGRDRPRIPSGYNDDADEIDEYAKNEVKAYKTQIDFLSNWIQKNCDS